KVGESIGTVWEPRAPPASVPRKGRPAMKLRHVVLGFAVVAFVVLGIAAYQQNWLSVFSRQDRFTTSKERGEVVSSADYRLSGPYAYDNLTVFLVHGPETLDGSNFLTLSEALEQKKAVVHETSEVNQLAIENLSGNQDVYVDSGDVVKGGKQDRTLPYDAIVGTRSGRVPIDSFCVESGRWSKRGKEDVVVFAASTSNVGNVKSLKGSLSSGREAQGEVWRGVEQTQERLSKKLGGPGQGDESKASLQLT